jgi:hypothetical protein
MKLSIYKAANFPVKNKQDKIRQGILASAPDVPTIAEANNEEQLIELVTSYAWSPSIFSGTRLDANFISTDFMTLDIDSGMTIPQAEKKVQALGLCCLCLPSPSYSQEMHKFRLVFPLAKTIFSPDDFEATWDWLQKQFPELDAQCSDMARFYCASNMADGFWQDGEFLVPVKGKIEEPVKYNTLEHHVLVPEGHSELVKFIYGKAREKIPESVSFFIENAHTGIPGGWVNALNAFTFSLALSGVDAIIIEEVVEKLAPQPLDKVDSYQIKRAIRDGNRHREDSL